MNYTMQDVAKGLDLSIYTIRYYDKEGLLPNIRRNSSGHRIFSVHDIENLSMICCLKKTGMPLRGIKTFIDLEKEGDSTLINRNKQIQTHQKNVLSHINELQEMLKQIEKKLDYYNAACFAYENGDEIPCCTLHADMTFIEEKMGIRN